jgi:hypothetical protein
LPDYYKLAELSLNEMDIYIEEQFLLKMVNFFSLNISNWGKTEQTVEEVTTTYAPAAPPPPSTLAYFM